MGSRAKAPVGSAPWMLSERQQASEFIEQEAEELSYSVRNDFEWLNEHMSDILSRNQVNVADIFKTPGKLRGKTPRTVRKRNPLETRAPLTDVFSAVNTQAGSSPSQKTQFYKQISQLKSAERSDAHTSRTSSPAKRPIAFGKENVDSGYHGITDDGMDVDAPAASPKRSPKKTIMSPPAPGPARTRRSETTAEDRRITDDSFVSAKEDPTSRPQSKAAVRDDDEATIPVDVMDLDAIEEDATGEGDHENALLDEQLTFPSHVPTGIDDLAEQMDVDGVRSPSEGSSPVKPLLRKSSLTFAALPAREPVVTKQSIGARVSRTSHVDYKSQAAGRSMGGKSFGNAQQNTDALGQDGPEHTETTVRPELSRGDTTTQYHKSTTQRLHERINLLGKSKDTRPSKSIPSITQAPQAAYPQLPTTETEPPVAPAATAASTDYPTVRSIAAAEEDDDEDDWIAPVRSLSAADNRNPPPSQGPSSTNKVDLDRENTFAADSASELVAQKQRSPERLMSPERPPMHHKSISASAITSPTKAAMAPDPMHKKMISVSNPDRPATGEATTPNASPKSKRHPDGPLSASKAKFYSVLKSAKGIFASSAGASAQAKMEALSPAAPRHRDIPPSHSVEHLFSPKADIRPAPAIYPNIQSEMDDLDHADISKSSPSKAQDGRRTRSSSEREEKRKAKEAAQRGRADVELEKARQKERDKATATALRLEKTRSFERQREDQLSRAESRAETLTSQEDLATSADDIPPPPPPKSLLPTAPKPRETRRPMKPAKEPLQKAKPAPVVIKVGSQRIGHNQPSTAALSASLQDSLPPAPPPKQSNVSTKPTLAKTGSSTSLKNSTQTARKALEAAAKKKEQEEKAAQRKTEQKRELEQKRAAKLEEERRLEQQRKAAEQQRMLEAKKAAQRQAADAKRLEQQRQQAPRPASRQGNDLAHALQNEKSHAGPAHNRADLGGARPVSRMNVVQDPPRPVIPPINPAKPPKRVFQADADDDVPRPMIQRNPPSFQELNAKRRRTNEENEEDEPRRSVMAPPIRNSNIRKEPTKFTHGYMQAPPPASHASSMFKATVTAQHQLQHGKPGQQGDMGKFAGSAKIPFAENPNPAGPAGQPSNSQFKTPARPANANGKSAAKSSPHYPNGENIALPEILTDSEDEDSDNEFSAPSWVNSPALRELLSQQQLVDPQEVFGPIAPLQMEEIFKNKDRHKRFRDRTSSANWNGADRLTEEERRRDREGRERLMRDGAWTYQNGLS